MTIHHLNCGTLHPRIPAGTQSLLYCLLVETNDGLLLVDTGFGTGDYLAPTRFIRLFTWLLGLDRDIEETALHRVEALGFARQDVRHIVLTHLHCDHTGGLPDFPHARVHAFATEYESARNARGLFARFYEPDHWRHQPNWHLCDESSTVDWFGFSSIQIDEGISPEVRFVHLPGHTPGHCGVAISVGTGWLLHAGDATYPFYQREDPRPPFRRLPGYLMDPPYLLERMVTGGQTPRLRELLDQHGECVTLICSNDLVAYSHYAEASLSR